VLGLDLSIQRNAARGIRTHVFLLAGQSNMVGRADFDGGAGYPDGSLQWSQSGGLVPAAPPLDHVDPHAGDMGLAVQFAIDHAAAHPNAALVFVPSACGGSGFKDGRWTKGGDLYEAAVARANAAMAVLPDAIFAGILWHQGETDAQTQDDADGYAAALDAMIADMREDVTAADATTPFVAGQLHMAGGAADSVRAALADLPNRMDYTGFAGSEGLSAFDGIHFDAPSLRALGARYLAALYAARANADLRQPTITSPSAFAVANGTVDIATLTADEAVTWAITGGDDGGLFSIAATSGSLAFVVPQTTAGDFLVNVTATDQAGNPSAPQAITVTVAEAPSALAIEAFATANDGDSLGTYNFPAMAIAGAGSKVVGIVNRNDGIASVTVGGVSAIPIASVVHSQNELSFWLANGVEGAAADVVVNYASAPSRCFAHLWSLSRQVATSSATLTSAANDFSGHTSIAGTADVVAGGLLLALANAIVGSPDWTWTGVSERTPETEPVGEADFWSGAADHEVTLDEEGRPVGLDFGDTQLGGTLALLSIAPA
jgi:hypothetical protein